MDWVASSRALIHPVGDQPAVRPQQHWQKLSGGDQAEHRAGPGELQHQPRLRDRIHVRGRLIACPARYNRKFVTVSAANMPADRRPAPGSWSAAAVTLADFQATAPFATRRGLSGYLHPWAPPRHRWFC